MNKIDYSQTLEEQLEAVAYLSDVDAVDSLVEALRKIAAIKDGEAPLAVVQLDGLTVSEGELIARGMTAMLDRENGAIVLSREGLRIEGTLRDGLVAVRALSVYGKGNL